MSDRDRQGKTQTPTDPAVERPSGDPTSRDHERRQMEQGDRTKPSQPPGTTPIERDRWPINQER